MGFFPVDARTLDYLRLTGRAEDEVALVEAYCKAQGLWRDDKTALVAQVRIQGIGSCAGREFSATPRIASHLGTHGVDVGLVELPADATGAVDPCFRSVVTGAVSVLAPDELERLLGSAPCSGRVDAFFQHYVLPGTGIAAVAYWALTQAFPLAGWGTPTFRSLVEWEGPDDSFRPGASGACVLTKSKPSPRSALGIQSFSPTDASWRRGFGTSVSAAHAWLAASFPHPLTFRWARP